MMLIGKFDARQRLAVVRRLCGHDSMGPSEVSDQSVSRTTLPISPPASQSATGVFKPSVMDTHEGAWAVTFRSEREHEDVSGICPVWVPRDPRAGSATC